MARRSTSAPAISTRRKPNISLPTSNRPHRQARTTTMKKIKPRNRKPPHKRRARDRAVPARKAAQSASRQGRPAPSQLPAPLGDRGTISYDQLRGVLFHISKEKEEWAG